ncbi:hypothetical protein ACFLTU_01690 [Bacteroidota bacterium]
MLKEVHEHILTELQQSSRTDTIFVVAAVIFNLVVLGINWGVAEPDRNQIHPASDDIILSMLIAATVLINLFVVRALLTGRDTRQKLLGGLVTMYKDNNVDKYYDDSLLSSYGFRYKLFVAVLLVLASISIFVPLLMRIFT